MAGGSRSTHVSQPPARPAVAISSTANPTRGEKKPLPAYAAVAWFKKLDSQYKYRDRSFFTFGKVFSTLWHTSAGEKIDENPEAYMESGDTSISLDRRYLLPIHSKKQWFIVVREKKDCCHCVPINTYGGQGLTKKRANGEELATAYGVVRSVGTASDQPFGIDQRLPRRDRKDIGIEVLKELGWPLDPNSTIDYGRIYTVEHNTKVMAIGSVVEGSMKDLLDDFSVVNGLAPAAVSASEEPDPIR